MKKSEKAAEIFNDGYNCAQAVLSAFNEELGMSDEIAKSVSAPFGGGMGRKGFICGAVSAALMAIGSKTGGSKEQKEANYAKTVKFLDRFTENNGSIICRKLLQCDISTPEGQKKAKELDLHGTVCVKLVMDAVELLEKEFLYE